jgi:hypothetical protein
VIEKSRIRNFSITLRDIYLPHYRVPTPDDTSIYPVGPPQKERLTRRAHVTCLHWCYILRLHGTTSDLVGTNAQILQMNTHSSSTLSARLSPVVLYFDPPPYHRVLLHFGPTPTAHRFHLRGDRLRLAGVEHTGQPEIPIGHRLTLSVSAGHPVVGDGRVAQTGRETLPPLLDTGTPRLPRPDTRWPTMAARSACMPRSHVLATASRRLVVAPPPARRQRGPTPPAPRPGAAAHEIGAQHYAARRRPLLAENGEFPQFQKCFRSSSLSNNSKLTDSTKVPKNAVRFVKIDRFGVGNYVFCRNHHLPQLQNATFPPKKPIHQNASWVNFELCYTRASATVPFDIEHCAKIFVTAALQFRVSPFLFPFRPDADGTKNGATKTCLNYLFARSVQRSCV